MRDIESVIEDALFSLQATRGALMVISEGNQLDQPDYAGLSGQIGSYVLIAQKEIKSLDRAIKDLSELVLKQKEDE